MSKITIGDKLICIDTEPLKGNNVAPLLEAGKTYPAQEVFYCDCGQSHVDVGLTIDENVNFVTCYNCKKKLPFTEKENLPLDADRRIHWCHPSRFLNANP